MKKRYQALIPFSFELVKRKNAFCMEMSYDINANGGVSV
jgi:hypothetical protein